MSKEKKINFNKPDRLCPNCAGIMKETAQLKLSRRSYGRMRNVHRYKCIDCGLETSDTSTNEESDRKEVIEREREKLNRDSQKTRYD